MNAEIHPAAPPREARTPNSLLVVDDDGIIRQTFSEQAPFDLIDAQETVVIIDAMVQGGVAALLLDMRSKFRITREAREHFASVGFTDPRSVVAFLVNSRIGETFANLYIKINKPPYTTRVFHDEDSAKAWLLAQRREILGS